MADPTKYVPGYSYSNWQATNPKKPLPADEVDNDFTNASRSINETVDAVKDVRRSDGKLKNGIVGPDAISPALSLGFTLRGSWLEGETYSTADGVVYANAFYAARTTHVATAANAPGDTNTWNYLFSIDDLVVAGALSMPRVAFEGDGTVGPFPLTFTPTSRLNLLVTVGGVLQATNTYEVEGNGIVFAEPTPLGYEIEVRGFATTAELPEPVDGSVTYAKLSPAVQASVDKADTALQPAAIGTTVQAHDADLTAIAALTSAENKVPYSTGLGTWALADFTSVGRDLVAAATVAAQRTALEVTNDNILDRTATADFTDGGAYVFRGIVEREVNLLMFAPSLANGADVSVAMQRMMTAAAATGKPARIPAHPLGFSWTINTGVNVPGCKVLCDGAVVETSQSIVMFTATGHNVLFERGSFRHHADGEAFNLGTYVSSRLDGCDIVADSAAATTHVVLMSGANQYIDDVYFTNNRVGAHCVKVLRAAGSDLNINSRINGCYMGGTGWGVSVISDEVGARVEGFVIDRLNCILTGSEHITVQSVLEMRVTNSLLDLGSGTNVAINPAGPGIEKLVIENCWLSCASNPTGLSGGANVKSTATGVGAVDVKVVNCRLNYASYGVALTDNMSDVLIADNTFSGIDQADIGGPFDDWIIRDNVHKGTNTHLSLTEGAGGGSVSIKGERFNSAGSVSLTIATRNRWVFGDTTGKKFRNKATATTAASPASPSYLLVPHGLTAAPRLSRILLQGSFATGAYTQINVNVAAVDATNVTVQIHHTQVIAGTITVAMDCEI